MKIKVLCNHSEKFKYLDDDPSPGSSTKVRSKWPTLPEKLILQDKKSKNSSISSTPKQTRGKKPLDITGGEVKKPNKTGNRYALAQSIHILKK